MFVSVVLPCLNEERNVKAMHLALVRDVAPLVSGLEVIFVDDGSTDGTMEEVETVAASDERVRYVSFSRNFGKEAAMLAGLRASRGDVVVLMDADLQHPPSLVGRMLESYGNGYDQVVARRTRTGDSRFRTLLAHVYYKTMNRVTEVDLVDGEGDFRLLSRRAVDVMLSMPERNRFSKGLFAWVGLPCDVIEYSNVVRDGDRSRWTVRGLVNYGIDGVLSFNDRPIRLAIWMGVAVCAAATGYLVWLLYQVLVHGVESPGYVTLITAVLFLGGLQLIAIGIVGEYIGRIYHETKRRPHYVVLVDSDEPERIRRRLNTSAAKSEAPSDTALIPAPKRNPGGR